MDDDDDLIMMDDGAISGTKRKHDEDLHEPSEKRLKSELNS